MKEMTLDEAIQHCEEVAENKWNDVAEARLQEQDKYADDCEKCSAEHRQLAERLKQLKGYKNIADQIAMAKRNIQSENSDYLTGCISALSADEGMIAEVGNENH